MPKNRDMPAHPRNDAVERSGLTKLEYAAVHILAGMVARQLPVTPETYAALASHAVRTADALYDMLGGEYG